MKQFVYEMTFANRVRQGIELLDQHLPGWENQIALDKLNLGSDYDCVLGQLYGSWARGLDELEIDSLPFGYHGSFSDYPVLQRLWTYAIKARTGQLEGWKR